MDVIQNEVKLEVILTERMEALGKTPLSIAGEIEGMSEGMVKMILSGDSQLPITRIVDFARVLELDPRFLFRRRVEEYSPEMKQLIDLEATGSFLSAREIKLINEFRRLTGDRDVEAMLLEKDGLLEVICLQ